MKNLFFFVLCLLSVSVFGADYSFEYKKLPEKVDCRFVFDINTDFSSKSSNSQRVVDFSSGKIADGKFTASVVDNEDKNTARTGDYVLKNNGLNLEIKNLTGMSLFPKTEVNDSILTSQFVLPGSKIKVGDRWQSEIRNPMSDRKLYVSSVLLSVADNLATVFFSVKSPYSGEHIKENRQLMRQKLDDGSTFFLHLYKYRGHAEITGSGIWQFDIEEGCLVFSEQFFRFTSLVSDRELEEAEKLTDYIYMNVNLHSVYNFK